uniref:Uncharacterized protein n=1 Tax=Eubacterium cellulosolvens (strain ATCC 43171 / JCM 9499 / 6) TaxID=633697 RepID=I5AXD9_EUBC6
MKHRRISVLLILVLLLSGCSEKGIISRAYKMEEKTEATVKDSPTPVSSKTKKSGGKKASKSTEAPTATTTPTTAPTPTPTPVPEVEEKETPVENVSYSKEDFENMKGLGFLLCTAYTARNSSLPSGSFVADDEDLYFDREHFSAEAVGAWMQSISTGCPTVLADQSTGSEYRFPLKMVQGYMASMVGWNNEDPFNGTVPLVDGAYEWGAASGAPGWNMNYIGHEVIGTNVVVTAQLIENHAALGLLDKGDYELTLQSDPASRFGFYLVKARRVREGMDEY